MNLIAMNDIEHLLKRLKKAELLELLVSLQGIDDRVDTAIATYIEGEPVSFKRDNRRDSGLANNLERQVKSICVSDEWIDYGSTHYFAGQLEVLLEGLQDLYDQGELLPALIMLDELLDHANDIFARVDDSDGELSVVFYGAIMLWLNIAEDVRVQNLRPQTNWVERLRNYFDHNDYGVFDELLPESAGLLTEAELRQLAWRFESDAKKALKKKNVKGYNREAARACIGMESVAQALQDVELFERATLIKSPQPNELQRAALANFCLAIELPQRALEWLQGEWDERFAANRQLALEACYEQLGLSEDLLASRLDYFEKAPCWMTLAPLLDIADKKLVQQLKKQVIEQAPTLPDIEDALEMLLGIGKPDKAAAVAISRSDELITIYYPMLSTYAEQFIKQSPLAAALCYRALLDDILNKGRSKAYHYAESYFKQLLILDKRIKSYRGHTSASQYIAGLQEQHWRKRSFWDKADYPNKASD